MEVTIVSGIDPNVMRPGGTRTYVLSLIPILLKKGIITTLIGISHDKKETSSDLLFNFIPIVEGSNISGYKFFINLILKVQNLKLSKYSIIHTQRPDRMFPFVLFYRKNPKVCTLHGIVYKGFFLKKNSLIRHIYQFIEKFTLERTNRIIAVNEDTKKKYLEIYPWLKDKIDVITVGIDTELFRPIKKYQLRETYGFKEKDRIIVSVGRLEKEKDLEFLLRSFKKINNHQSTCISNYKLVLVGDGRERKNLENLARELELKDIIFMGTLEHDKIPEIINCADVFVLTSLYESGPIVIQEALSCGIPVVTTEVGRVGAFIKNDSVGRIVNRNENEFIMAIKEMLEMDKERTKNACRQEAMNFSFETTANRTIEVYRSLQEN